MTAVASIKVEWCQSAGKANAQLTSNNRAGERTPRLATWFSARRALSVFGTGRGAVVAGGATRRRNTMDGNRENHDRPEQFANQHSSAGGVL